MRRFNVRLVPALSIQLFVVAVALFLFVGAAHADILVSNYASGTVGKYYDDGTVNNLNFLQGASTAEGVQCVKLTSNEVYVANAESPTIRVYNLTTGVQVSSITVTGPVRFVALAMNADASVLYGADTNTGLWAINLSGGPCTPASPCQAGSSFWDVIVGPDGNVYASNHANLNQGVTRFPPATAFGWNPGNGTVVIQGTSYGTHSLAHAGAMTFDGGGNLWVNNANATSTDGIFEFTGPQNPNPFKYFNFTADPNAYPLGTDLSPVNPPAPPVDPCKGCIVVAEFLGKPGYSTGDVDQIDPTTCTGTVANPGTCQFYASTPLITNVNRPKYVRFIENCNDTGYVEICKMSCLTNPVTGNFTFTATNQGNNSGTITVPVNACSGAIQIPNGTVTINEQFSLGGGTEVAGITAYNYDYLGDQINALLSFNLPFQTGNVDVVSGDVSTETVVGFTNCASGPGELKICKVAGPGVHINTSFEFEVTWFLNQTLQFANYPVPAGPPPEGYCVIAGSYPVGTSVNVREPYLSSNLQATNITVAPADRGGTQQLGGCHSIFSCPYTVAIIDSGTTEVTFTNATQPNP